MGNITLIIEDNGIGFDFEKVAVVSSDDRGLGLIGMRERMALFNGTLEIESSSGNGTTIYAHVPLAWGREGEKL